MAREHTASLSHCPRCRQPADPGSAPGYCTQHHRVWQADRGRAVTWAYRVLASSRMVIMDTETTGLGVADEIVEIALLTSRNQVLFDSLIRPSIPIPAVATAVHQLDDRAVAHAPTWPKIHDRVVALLQHKVVVTYNAEFDRRLIAQTAARYGLPPLQPARWICAMKAYAAY